MGDVYFYHLTESALEAAVPPLVLRARERGWRVEIRGRDAERMAALDRALWLGPEEGFLPHGLQGGAHDALQPVILTTGAQVPAGPKVACLVAVDGAGIAAADAAAVERGCLMFDGTDPGAVEGARAQWRALTSAGIAAQYWAQEDGRWVKKR